LPFGLNPQIKKINASIFAKIKRRIDMPILHKLFKV